MDYRLKAVCINVDSFLLGRSLNMSVFVCVYCAVVRSVLGEVLDVWLCSLLAMCVFMSLSRDLNVSAALVSQKTPDHYSPLKCQDFFNTHSDTYIQQMRRVTRDRLRRAQGKAFSRSVFNCTKHSFSKMHTSELKCT